MRPTVSKPNLLVAACPRCRGDLYRDMLETDVEYVCLQCGRRAATRKPVRQLTLDDDEDGLCGEVA
jgi:DNA-directed RNA polymerase subunit RPC12/RpoP